MSYVSTRDALWGAGSLVLATMVFGGMINLPVGAVVLGIALLIIGLLMLMNTIPGPTVVGGALFVTALLLLIANPVGQWLGRAMLSIIPVLAGIVLVAVGLTLLLGKRTEAPTIAATAI